MPAFAKSDDEGAPSVNQVWAIEAGGPDQPGVIWAGTIPAALFRNEDHGADPWQLVESLGRCRNASNGSPAAPTDPALHTICVDPRDSNRIVVRGVLRRRLA
jgi:hypothetical protein